RCWWARPAVTGPLLLRPRSGMIPGLDFGRLLGQTRSGWVQPHLATAVTLWGGWPFFERAWRAVRTWNLNMYSPIGLGVAAAYGFSVVALAFPALLPDSFKMNGAVPLYFESAAVITVLVLVGAVLQLRP